MKAGAYIYRKPGKFNPPRMRGNSSMVDGQGNPLYDDKGRSVVRVTYADGSTRVANPSEFRKNEPRRIRKVISQARGIETARLSHGHNFNS